MSDQVTFYQRICEASKLPEPDRIRAVRRLLLDTRAADAIEHMDNGGESERMMASIKHHVSSAGYTAPEIQAIKHWGPMLDDLLTDEMREACAAAMVEPAPEPEMVYILDARTVVGNCAMFWGVDGNGYVCDLNKAGLYRRDQVPSRDTDIAVPVELAKSLAVTHVRIEGLSRAGLLDDLRKRQSEERRRLEAGECCKCGGQMSPDEVVMVDSDGDETDHDYGYYEVELMHRSCFVDDGL